jgi:hypothetical protein
VLEQCLLNGRVSESPTYFETLRLAADDCAKARQPTLARLAQSQ